MTKLSLVCFLAIIFSSVQGQDSLVIPEERRIQWDPGIPGGIPQIDGPVESILDHGADPTGVTDSWQAVSNAIDALPAGGGVVYIPEGTYRVGSKISVGKDGIVFRGDGRKTRLLMEYSGDCIEVITYRRGAWQALPDGAAKGVVSLTVENGAAFTPGGFAEIEQDNDPLLMYTSAEWIQSWAENAVGQMLRVTSVEGNEITFEPPLHLDFPSELNARIRPQGLVTGVGFEDLYIEKTAAEGHTFLFKNTAYCWIKNVESCHTRRSHLSQNSCLGNEVRESYFHRSFDYGGGGSGYGVECGFHVTATLAENNIFDSLRHAMMVHVGANGNVFGYNYSIHPVQGEGEMNLNAGWIPPDVSVHGHYPFMNLFEGNRVDEIGIGDYWGPAGPGNTYFRNSVNGEGILYYDASHVQNVIGNITAVLRDTDGESELKLEHGNMVGGTIIWDPDIPARDLPDSYYLDTVPAFFGEMDWPLYGPDVAEGNKLPAQVRFENLPFLHVTHDGLAGRYEKLEFTIENGKTYMNPFDPGEVDIFGIFVSPSGDSMKINAFWDGSGWKLRFAGAETGQWSYTVGVVDRDGREEKTGRFDVVASENKGWIGPSPEDPHYLTFDDGSPFYGVGMAVPWLVYDPRYYEQPGLLARLKGHGVNFINWLFTSWDILLIRDSYAHYSMEDAEKFDCLIADAEAQGIRLLLGIWIHDLLRDDPHPWSGFYDWQSNPFNQLTTATGFFSDSASWEYQKKYYRYIIARWGYSTSVGMWHTVAEINGTNAIYDPLAMENDPEGWHNRINRYFTENDPFGHPTSVSGSGGYDFSQGWEVTQCPQVHEYPYPADRIRENPGRIAYWSDRLTHAWDKPCLVGEFGKAVYEEGISESFLHNGIWAGLMSGACATPLHWWGGQIASRPENFSTFSETMLEQLRHLGEFVRDIDMSEHHFTSLYGAPEGHRISLTSMPEGEVYGLRGDSLGICWIYHVEEHSTEDFTGVGLSFPGLPEGRYTVSFYDTWNGEWMDGALEAQTGEGTLQFVCPDFTSDLAVKIAYAGPPVQNNTGPERASGIRIYPNPCDAFLRVEHTGPVGRIRLVTITGREIPLTSITGQQIRQETMAGRVPYNGQAGSQVSTTLDLSSCPPGIYLLEISDGTGPPEVFRLSVL